MSLFRNANEQAFVDGKKHFTDVIKNTGSPDMLIWRQPEEDFNTNSTLIVMPGEEAIFVNGGVIEQVFGNGTYKLSTDNYPFISRLKNMFSGGISTFNCVVYFVKKAHSVEILWGTSSPIQVRDKLLGISTKIRARGSYKIQISNAGLFLTKLVGNTVDFVGQQELIDKFFANEFQSKIRSSLTKALNETQTELIGIESRIDELSEEITPSLAGIFDEYGLSLVNFAIAGLNIDDDELRRKYDEIGMDAIQKMRMAQADKSVMGILGDDWAKQQAVNILGGVANNPGAGGVAATGAGLAMGIGAGGVFGSMAQQMFSPMSAGAQQTPPAAPEQAPVAAAPAQSGAAPKQDPFEALETLAKMLNAGLITQDEYDGKKAEIMSRM